MIENRDLYNHLAKGYNQRQENPATSILRGKEKELMQRASGLVLDLGCGTGYHLDFAENVVGLDISEKILHVAKTKNKTLVQGDIENLPIKNSCVDTVCCFYGTLNIIDLEMSVEEISRIVKVNGNVLLSVTSVMDIDKYRSSQENKIKKFRLEGKPVKTRLFEKEEIVEKFFQKGFRLKYFDSIFRIQKPRWGNFRSFSPWEKFKLKIEKVFPKKWGKIYLMVFEKYKD